MKKVLLVGLGKSNLAVKDFLLKKGYEVYTYDDKLQADYNYRLLKKELPLFDLALVSPGIKFTSKTLDLIRLLAINIVNDLSLALYFLKRRFKLIVVTGSNGKTTVVTMLEGLLKDLGYKALALGNNGRPIFSYLNAIEDLDYLILEVSSYQAMLFYDLIDVLVLTSLSYNHLDSYDNFKEYVAAKKRLVRLSEKVVASKELARKLKIEVNYNEYIDVKDVKSFDYNLVLNVLKCLGLETDKIDFDFNKINIECRNELFLFDGDISFIDNSKSTSFEATTCALNERNKKIILILGGHLKSKTRIKIRADYILIYGDEGKLFKKYIDDRSKVYYFCSLKEATSFAIELAKKIKVCDVLLSPSGSSTEYKNYLERGRAFKEMVKKAYEL